MWQGVLPAGGALKHKTSICDRTGLCRPFLYYSYLHFPLQWNDSILIDPLKILSYDSCLHKGRWSVRHFNSISIFNKGIHPATPAQMPQCHKENCRSHKSQFEAQYRYWKCAFGEVIENRWNQTKSVIKLRSRKVLYFNVSEIVPSSTQLKIVIFPRISKSKKNELFPGCTIDQLIAHMSCHHVNVNTASLILLLTILAFGPQRNLIQPTEREGYII